jgi:hypothetical protein
LASWKALDASFICSKFNLIATPVTNPERTTGSCFGHFDLDIARALKEQLQEFLSTLTPASLADRRALDNVPREGGVYRLLHNSLPVYVGKADDSLQERLRQHASDIDGRQGIQLSAVSFICASVSRNWSAYGIERQLIDSRTLPWQGSGFGNNDPGRERDTSRVKESHWDALYPIRLDWKCEQIDAKEYSVAELLREIKRAAPFVFRYQDIPKSDSTLGSRRVRVPLANMAFWELVELVVGVMPGWQATALPGYTILYKENNDRYLHALKLASGPTES